LLIVCDIEGCIMPARRGPVDLTGLARCRSVIGAMRERAGAGFTICTGRPAPYVEAVLQFIGGPWPGVPAVVENGAFLYDAASGELIPHPLLTGRRHALEAANAAVVRLLASPRWPGARREPGKEVCISLNPPHGQDIAAFYREVAAELGPVAEHLTITHSRSAVDITPRGIDKGAGFLFLCERVGMPPVSCVAIGDTEGDLPMLERAGHAAAPANCAPQVKDMAEYVSPFSETAGVADIIEHYAGLGDR
jgi:hypothetical protein